MTGLILFRVVAPTFVAGVIVDRTKDEVTQTAPILKNWRGATEEQVRERCHQMKWELQEL